MMALRRLEPEWCDSPPEAQSLDRAKVGGGRPRPFRNRPPGGPPALPGVCYYPPMAFGRKKDAEPAAGVAPVFGPDATPPEDSDLSRDPFEPDPEDAVFIPEAWAARPTATDQESADEIAASAFGGTDPDNASDASTPQRPTSDERYAEAAQRRTPSHDEEW